jgi:membrane protease YdiL (CAAX protease family)
MSTSPYRKDASSAVSDGEAAGAHAADTPAPGQRSGSSVPANDRREVLAREKDRFGGIKWGSAFFGWLTATGTAVILTAILAAAGATVGVATGTDTGDAQRNAATIGLVGGLTLLAVILVAYFCGGYVAGRMARFSGVKQGIAVWIWAIVIVAAVAVAGAVLGDKYDLLDRVGGFPRLPIGGDNVTTGSIVAVVIALVAALIGAILGGLAGMRYHRRVDEAGLGR